MQRIGRSVFLSVDANNNNKVIIKYEPPVAQNIVNKISRIIFGGSLPYKNEIYINDLLNNNKFQYFKYPKGFISKLGNSIQFEFISGDERRLNAHEKERGVNALIEFSSLAKQLQNQGIVLKLIENPLIKVIMSILRSNKGFKVKYKALIIVIFYLFRKTRTIPVLLHNDLQCKNIISKNSHELFFIDFEDAVIEKKLVILDVFNILFDRNRMKINKNLLNKFFKTFTKLSEAKQQNKALKHQVRVCMIKMAFTPCSQERDQIKNKLEMDRIMQIIINNENYTNWWQQQ